MNNAGAKLGWWLGGLGSLLWLPIMSIIWAAQGGVATAALGLLVFLGGIAYLVLLAPWRFPHTQIRVLFLGFIAILLCGAAVAVWHYRHTMTTGQGMPLMVLWTLFLPVFSFGRKTWADLTRRQ